MTIVSRATRSLTNLLNMLLFNVQKMDLSRDAWPIALFKKHRFGFVMVPFDTIWTAVGIIWHGSPLDRLGTGRW